MTATWIHVEGRHPLAAQVHEPARSPTGFVVVAPPVGLEGAKALRASLRLAGVLARAGRLVVRFDWRGTAGSSDIGSDESEPWCADLAAVARFLYDDLGADNHDLLAWRSAAPLVADALVRPGATAPRSTLLVDPPRSGRVAARAEAATIRVGTGLPVTTDDLPRIMQLLARLRAEPVGQLRAAGLAVHVHEDDQDDLAGLFDVEHPLGVTPARLVDRLTKHLLALGDTQHAPVAWTPTTAAVVDDTGTREELVRIGPQRLPGTLVHPHGEARAALLHLATGTEPSYAPGTLGSTALRRLAGEGVVGLRFDRPGVAETADPDATCEPPAYDAAGVAATTSAAGWLRTRYDVPVHLSGVCAGSWYALKAAAPAAAEQVVAINPIAWHTDHVAITESMREDRPDEAAAETTEGRHGLISAVKARVGSDAVARAKAKVPGPVWRWLGRHGITFAVAPLVSEATAAGTRLQLLLTPHDLAYLEQQRGLADIEHARRRGAQLGVTALLTDDHALFTRAAQEEAADLLRDVLANRATRTRLVTVVMPTHNARETLGRAVRSALEQVSELEAIGWDLEVLVVDDGSTDGTTELADSLAGRRVRVVHTPNRGPAAARNRAFAEARGSLIALLDSDDEFLRGHLAAAVRLIERSGARTFVTVNPRVRTPRGPTRRRLLNGRFPSPATQPTEILSRNFISIGSVFPAAMLRDVGGMDEGFRAAEDWLFWITALHRGWRAVLSPRASYLYQQASGSLTCDRELLHACERRALAQALETLPLTPEQREQGTRRASTGSTDELVRAAGDALVEGRYDDAAHALRQAADLDRHRPVAIAAWLVRRPAGASALRAWVVRRRRRVTR